jgi:hypothetical protein
MNVPGWEKKKLVVLLTSGPRRVGDQNKNLKTTTTHPSMSTPSSRLSSSELTFTNASSQQCNATFSAAGDLEVNRPLVASQGITTTGVSVGSVGAVTVVSKFADLTATQLVLQGSTSGSLTVQPAGATTTHTLTLPSAQGAAGSYLRNNGAGALSWTPQLGFSVYKTNQQSVANSTQANVVFNQVTVDTAGGYSTSTGRFTPQTAGYWSFSWLVTFDNLGSQSSETLAFLQKNGTGIVSWGNNFTPSIHHYTAAGGSTHMVYLNGSTDYVNVVVAAMGETLSVNPSNAAPIYSVFSGCLS